MRTIAHGCGCFLSIPFWLVFGGAFCWVPAVAVEAGLPSAWVFPLSAVTVAGQLVFFATWGRSGADKADG